MSLEEYKEAKEVYKTILEPNEKTKEYHMILENELMNITNSLLDEGNIEEAIYYANLLDDSSFKKQIMFLYFPKDAENDFLSIYLTKLYEDELTIDEINNSSLKDYEKEILLMAYYEKYNLNYNLNALKNLRNIYREDKNILSLITKLLEHSKRKLKVFDFGFYEDVLSCKVTFKSEIK